MASNMKLCSIAALLAVITYSTSTHAQQGTVQGIAHCTLLLYKAQQVAVSNQSPVINVESGTGFLVRVSNYVFLVTAEHVAAMLRPDSHVVFDAETETPYDTCLTNVIPIQLGFWFQTHPQADVAAVPLFKNSPSDPPSLAGRCFDLSMISPIN